MKVVGNNATIMFDPLHFNDYSKVYPLLKLRRDPLKTGKAMALNIMYLVQTNSGLPCKEVANSTRKPTLVLRTTFC